MGANIVFVGAAIGLVGGIMLSGLLWYLWLGGKGNNAPDAVWGRVQSSVITCVLTTLANVLTALLTHSILRSHPSSFLMLQGVLWGGLLGCLCGAFVGFAPMYAMGHFSRGHGDLWPLTVGLMTVACGLAEIVIGAATGAYLAHQLQA